MNLQQFFQASYCHLGKEKDEIHKIAESNRHLLNRLKPPIIQSKTKHQKIKLHLGMTSKDLARARAQWEAETVL